MPNPYQNNKNEDVTGLTQQVAGMGLNGPDGKAYVPPHLRNRPASAAQSDSASSFSSGGSRDTRNGDRRPYQGNARQGGGYFQSGANDRYTDRPQSSRAPFVDSKRYPLARNTRLEEELFGTQVNTGINFEKYDDIPVEVTGTDVPEPISSYPESHLDPLIKENIALCGYVTPTPVQKYAVSIVNGKRDLMACAQTGSGKTAAFLIPIISACMAAGQESKYQPPAGDYRSGRNTGYPTALIMAPTRELALQIYEESRKFCYRSWVRSCVVYGGADAGQQIREIQKGCDLLVATPGRLIDLIQRGKISLAGIKFLILDEADRQLDMGFEPQIRQIVQGEDMPGKAERLTLMFSATFPKDIQILARDFLNDYVFLSVGRVGSTSENIVQRIEFVEENDKREVLLDILYTEMEDSKSKADGKQRLTLVFVETKRAADHLEDYLYQAGFPSTSIHGDRTQKQREAALYSFRKGTTPIMVATAVAARGLDIPNVTHVVNYDLPTDIDDYVHRIGRTGRAGNVGKSTSFFNFNNKMVAAGLLELLREANQEIPEWLDSAVRQVTYEKSGGRSYGGGRGGRGGGGHRSGGGNFSDHRRGGGGSGGGNAGGSWGGRGNSSSQGFGNNNNNNSNYRSAW